MRDKGVQPVGKCFVQCTCDVPEMVGAVLLERDSTAWIDWPSAKVLRDEGKAEIIEYDQVLVDSVKGRPVMGEPLDLPGFVCDECWEQGKLTIYGREKQLEGHACSHRPNHGWPKGRPRKQKGDRKGDYETRRNVFW